ncbi:MAG: glycoside hydrolase family 3 N-terminal domain-containing protein [Prevotella sp.]
MLLSCPEASAQKMYHKGWIDFNKNGKKDVYENPRASIEDRVSDLLRQMTVDEKTCQLATLYGSGRVLKDALPTENWVNEVWKDGIGNIDEEHNGLGKFGSQYSFPYAKHVETLHEIQRWFVEKTRLGIPVDFTNEGIRGLCHDRATCFPSQSGQGCTWNRQLIRQLAHVEAVEARILGYTNIYSPVLDLTQDPRWGRCVESYGEDPYLVGELGKQMVLGLQAEGLVSTPKHFAVYSIPVGGRDGDTRTDPHVGEREMRTLYLEPFRKVFQEAGALGVMSSYNDYNGEPITGSYRFLTDILRKQWGFRGYVVSDSEALEFLYNKHHVVNNYEEACALAINAGLNIRTNFTQPKEYLDPLRKAVASGKITMQTLDERVAEVLRVKFMLGLFDNPYRGNAEDSENIVHCKEHQQVALEVSRQSIVLLKNANNTLPLSKSLSKIAVIGPNADVKPIGRYGPANAPISSVLEGIRRMVPQAQVTYEKGCNVRDPHYPESEVLSFPETQEERRMMDAAVKAASEADAVVVVLGDDDDTIGEGNSRTTLNLPGRQDQLLKELTETGKPVILIIMAGRATTVNYADAHVPAILNVNFPGEKGGDAIADVLFGDYNPGGRLSITIPRTVGQIPFAFPFKPGSDVKNKASLWGSLYPFGHGLSYTTFAYSQLRCSHDVIAPTDSVEVFVTVTNTGKVKGDEVVQLYIRDEVSSVTTYTKVLRGFERITLNPGEAREVRFVLHPRDLSLWDKDMNFVVEPGDFRVMVGASSKDIRMETKLQVQ